MDAISPTTMGPMNPNFNSGSISPRTAPAKQVAFKLIFEGPPYQARLPLRVKIYPHDTTDSIVATVKNFYGLYSSPDVTRGISFEDREGNTLIAQYENFQHGMDIYVRMIDQMAPAPSRYGSHDYRAPSQPPTNGYYHPDGYNRQPPPPPYEPQPPAQLNSAVSRMRSPSPGSGRGRRSTSTGTGNAASKKGRSRSSKNRSQAGGESHSESFNGYSSGDNAPGSASGRSREHLGNTNISLENIVEGGRRKRPKFESSELPLFAPPQMPAATSNPSVSPSRRPDQPRQAQPFAHPGPNPFSNPRPLQSPQSYSNGFSHPNMYPTPVSDTRHRGSFGFPSASGMGSGVPIAPTPDGTVNSCMSEEDKDVAIQLMRLGDFSNHGRASASTMDDTFSGRADASSSTGATSDADSEHSMHEARRQKLSASGPHKKIMPTTESHFAAPRESTEGSGDDGDYSDSEDKSPMAAPKPKNQKPKANTLVADAKARSQAAAKPKAPKPTKPKLKKAAVAPGPISPASLPDSRKLSVVSNPALALSTGEDDQPDLSTKPRCQRCRKSKKGCDRQRPCGRCKDAGIGADECISEDEGNGRKGRYGRHMGVPISKSEVPTTTTTMAAPLLPAMPLTAATAAEMMTDDFMLGGALDKNKKRKR